MVMNLIMLGLCSGLIARGPPLTGTRLKRCSSSLQSVENENSNHTRAVRMLKRQARAGAWREALETIRRSEAEVRLPIEAYNVAITACGQAGEWMAALGVLRTLTAGVPFRGEEKSGKRPRPDEVTFNAAGSAAAKAGQWRETVQVLQQARLFGAGPSMALYTSAIASCGRAGELRLALELFDQLREEQVPDTRAFTAAIDACAASRDSAKATHIFELMPQHVEPNARTYRALTAAAARSGDWKLARVYLDRCREPACIEAALGALRDAQGQAPPPAEVLFGLLELKRSEDYVNAYRCLVHFIGCVDLGKGREALEEFERGACFDASPTAWKFKRDRRVAHTQLIVACGRARNAPAALAVLESMRAKRLSPDLAAYNAALVACRKAGDADNAQRIFSTLIHRNQGRFKPDAISVAETITTLDRAGRIAEADAVLNMALEANIRLKQHNLDLDDEVDVSALPVPVAKAVVRRALAGIAVNKEAANPKTEELVIITGVGKKAASSPNQSLRTIILEMLRQQGFKPVVPDHAPGTIQLAPVRPGGRRSSPAKGRKGDKSSNPNSRRRREQPTTPHPAMASGESGVARTQRSVAAWSTSVSSGERRFSRREEEEVE